jgi:enterochelin esterase family protein
MSFIVNDVLGTIESKYRIKRSSLQRAVLGASSGGNISLALGITYPNIFGNVAAQSSQIQTFISDYFKNQPKLNLKLYLDLGTYDISSIIGWVRAFVPVIQSKGYQYIYREYNEGHSWGNWRAHIDDGLI